MSTIRSGYIRSSGEYLSYTVIRSVDLPGEDVNLSPRGRL